MESPVPSSQLSLLGFLERMIEYRSSICHQHAIDIDHQHCIGCVLVMEHMQKNFPQMAYGTEEQWVEEAAFCQIHERDIFAEFMAKEAGRVL